MQLTRSRGIFVVVLVAGLFFAAGSAWQRLARTPAPSQPPNTAQADQALNVVRYDRSAPQLQFVRVQPVLFIPEPLLEPLNGRVAYDENYTARVSTPIAGRVIKIEAQLGDFVKAGSPLAWLDSPEYAAAIADVSKTATDVSQKTRAYARAKELLDAGVVARKDFETAETELKTAQAEQRRTQLRLRNLAPGTSRSGEDGRFALRAPISGIVAERQVNPGAEARPDAPIPLFVLSDPAHVWVIIDLPERYLTKVKVGQVVSVETDAYKGVDLTGRIASIGQTLDAATRRVQVRCVVDNPQRLLKPEMYARVIPLAEERRKLARVANAALVTQGLYSYVFVETEPAVFEKRQVELGLKGSDETYVQKGVNEGERVVTTGALLLDAELATRH
jgi:cobalt-zinc-cadmium efflux system membrane fusion protein